MIFFLRVKRLRVMNQMVLYPGLIKRDKSRNIVIVFTGSGGSSSTTVTLNVTVVMKKMIMKVVSITTTTTKAVEVTPILSGSNGATALAWLSLVEDFGNDELAFFLFLVDAKMILMHYPISLLGFFLFAVVCVEH